MDYQYHLSPDITRSTVTHLFEVDFLEDCEGPANELWLLDLVLLDVNRLDLLLGAHDCDLAGAVALRGGADIVGSGHLLVPEPLVDQSVRLLKEGVADDAVRRLDEESPFGHAEGEMRKW